MPRTGSTAKWSAWWSSFCGRPNLHRILLLCALLCLAGCSEQTNPGVTELVYATPYAAAHPFSQADQVWMDYVEAESQGSLRIRPSWSGALLSSENSMLELRHGVADIGL